MITAEHMALVVGRTHGRRRFTLVEADDADEALDAAVAAREAGYTSVGVLEVLCPRCGDHLVAATIVDTWSKVCA